MQVALAGMALMMVFVTLPAWAGPSRQVDVNVRDRGAAPPTEGASGKIAVGTQCGIALDGASKAHLDSIVAEVVQIYLSGAARMDVGKITAGTVTARSDGGARVQGPQGSHQ